MPNLMINESYVSLDNNCSLGESEWYTTRYKQNQVGDLYRSLMREFGRCTSKIRTNDGQAVGWVFVKRMKYEDSPKTYLREVWVEVATAVKIIPKQIIPEYLKL